MPETPPSAVERRLAGLPDQPGVYLWKDAEGEVLYVGKAKRLKYRVRNYFTADFSDSPKHRLLRRLIADLETIVVPSEPQALLLENNLIKEHHPRFNVALRDDKSYPSIVVTVGEPFPRVLVVRRPDIPRSRYFGPYTDVGVLRRTLRIIRRLFTVRTCQYGLPDDAPDRPCLEYHIHRCLAPCVGLQPQADYRAMIDDVLAFLEGRTVEVRARLRERMEEAAHRLDYERAADVRNSIRWLDQLERPQTVELVGGGDADAVGYARDGEDAVGVTLSVRDGRVVSRAHRFLEHLAEEPDEAILSAFLVQYYLPRPGRARKVILPFPPADLESMAQLAPDSSWIVPQRGVNSRLVELADQNARHLLESFRLESFETEERVEDPVYALGRDLGLTTAPRSFICVDISTSQGRDTVGSLVWFEGGRPKKGEYRKFKIIKERGPEIGGPDDFAAIREVITRYFTRRQNEGKPLPDLVVIDGGKGQLGVAADAMNAVGLPHLPVVSLAKRDEEVFRLGQAESLKLPRRAPSLKLLQRARDEAHRFAVSFNRARGRSRTVTSELLSVPGIGPARRRVLLERFGSLAGVKLATPEEIASLPGFSTRLADRILNHLK
ncbi:MAG: excinuclease ABC subunit UvrC [Gemmatimonadetes bacterium]|nr:excinuclease ABC subunit UvrC [Gemmatimonadota bacterium]